MAAKNLGLSVSAYATARHLPSLSDSLNEMECFAASYYLTMSVCLLLHYSWTCSFLSPA